MYIRVRGVLLHTYNQLLRSPLYNVQCILGTFIYDNTNKGISGKMNWDGSVRFDVKANLQSERSGPGMIYTPTVHISTPGINPIGLRGTIKYAPWKVFETDLSLSGIYQAPVTVKCK